MSLVLQLQEYALEASADVGNLLHKALVVAVKLNLEKFEKWVRLELGGYDSGQVPSYRQLRGKLMARTGYGTKPAMIADRDMQEKLTTFPLRQSVAEISDLLAKAPQSVELNWADQGFLHRMFQTNAEFYLDVPSPQLKAILDAVKTQLIDWSLNLEKDGIIGEGLVFKEAEKTKAAKHEARLVPAAIYNFIQRVERLDQTNNNDGDVNNDIQSDE